MTKSKKTISVNPSKQLKTALKSVYGYRGILFFLFIAAIYGFILYRINVLSSVQPDQGALAKASQATKQPRIDAAVVKKIQDLQDNSVGAKSLFDQARQNPFQE